MAQSVGFRYRQRDNTEDWQQLPGQHVGGGWWRSQQWQVEKAWLLHPFFLFFLFFKTWTT